VNQNEADGELNEQPSAPAAEEPADAHDRSRLAGVAASIAAGARRLIDERPGARVRRVRRMGHEPLANLWDVRPEARRASIRELGLLSVPVEAISGTAVEGPPQRGGDFLPLPDRRSDDWRGRWQGIVRALDNLSTLPPIELIRFGDQYWVVDGHNRVAAALYGGQTDIDAVVQDFRLPGMPATPPSLIAPVLEGSLDVRNAGAGRYTRTAPSPDRLPIQRSDDRDAHSHEVEE
jgi:hypothetical protein